MRKLSQYSVAGLASGQVDAWKRVTVAGNDRTNNVISYEFQYPDKDYASRASVTLSNEDGEFTDVIQKGDVLQIEEGIVQPGGTVENFGGFYGLVIKASPSQERGQNTMKIEAADYVARLQDLDIDTQIESPKTAVESEGLTPVALPAPNTNMAQVFQFANTALCTRPAPLVFILDTGTNFKFLQESGYEVDYENGTLVLGSPINTTTFKVSANYHYYPAATALSVEDIIEEIITTEDGYGNTPFTVAEHLTETLQNVDGVTVDQMKPNYTASTIDGTTYPAGQVWYCTYSRITNALVAGDFTVPGGATVDDVSVLYGRIILNTPIPVTSVVTCNVAYTFRTLQATGVQVNYLSCHSKQVKNRLEAVQAANRVLAPNYVIGTRQTSPGKIWGRYQNQQVTEDSELHMATTEEIESDTDIYTRVLLYGRNINPTDIAMDNDVRFVIPESDTVLNDVRWDAVDWDSQGAPSATPVMANGRVEIAEGDAIQSVSQLARGNFEATLRVGANFQWLAGFVLPGSLGAAHPQGVYFASSGLYSSEPARDVAPQRGRVYCCCRDGSGSVSEYQNPDGVIQYYPVGEVDVHLRIEWTATEANFYVNGTLAATITTYLPASPAHVVFVAEAGTLSVQRCMANGGNGGEVHDEFLTQNYIGTAYRHPLNYVESHDGYRRYSTGIIAGQILTYPTPLVYVNGLPLVMGIHEVTDAPVTVVERAYTYDRSSGGIGENTRIDTDWAYEIHFSHRMIAMSRAITIYDSLGNTLFTVAANTPAYAEAADSFWMLTNLGTLLASIWGCRTTLRRMDYARGIYYVHPRDVGMRESSWDISAHMHRNNQYYFERQQTFSPATADYSVLYSDDIKDIDYENGIVEIREDLFAAELPENEHPDDTVEATFRFMEAYGTLHNAFQMIDGNMNTNAQMSFKNPPVPNHHLFTLDLTAEKQIDAIDIVGGFFIPPEGQNRKLHVEMQLSLYSSVDGITFTLPCKDAYKFDLSSGDVKSFEQADLGNSFSARYLQLRLESCEGATYGSASGIWPISIQQFRVYQDLIVAGEATLVQNAGDEDDTHVYDEDGLLAQVGDRLYKERRSDQFLGTRTHLERVAKGYLQEFYKNHSRIRGEVAFGPHYCQGSTVKVSNPTNKITERNYYVESVVSNNGRRSLVLARYP